jgi:hypothetical protein
LSEFYEKYPRRYNIGIKLTDIIIRKNAKILTIIGLIEFGRFELIIVAFKNMNQLNVNKHRPIEPKNSIAEIQRRGLNIYIKIALPTHNPARTRERDLSQLYLDFICFFL